ncbi:MAG: protein phosphatase [Planctomyces sp.]|nr:protein phosphatase [Planctomyces sp.]
MLRQVAPHLWVGNAGDLRDVRAVMVTGVAAVIELADSEPLATLPRDLIRVRIPLADGAGNPAWLLHLAVQTIVRLLQAEQTVLVTCSAGMNRSLCVASAVIAHTKAITLDEAIHLVTNAGPTDVSPALYRDITQLLTATPPVAPETRH